MSGWIKLHRQLKNSEIFRDREMLQMWIMMLLEASHNYCTRVVKKRLEVNLYPGQLIFGRKEWSKLLGIKEHTVYRNVKWFEEQEMISIMATKHYSIITILNWSAYQHENFAHQHAQEQEQQNEQVNDSDINDLEEVVAQEKAQQKHNKSTHNKNLKNINKKDILHKQIEQVFEFYKEIFEGYHKRLSLTKGRTSKIKERLKNYSVDEIKEAIRNIRTSKYHLGEAKENDKFYATIDFICRNDEMVEKWINYIPKDRPKIINDTEKSKHHTERTVDEIMQQGSVEYDL